jgi:hypothetical protein
MALKAHEIGGRVFAANAIIPAYEENPERTHVPDSPEYEGDLLACLLVDLHHLANAAGLDWLTITEVADRIYHEQMEGPA